MNPIFTCDTAKFTVDLRTIISVRSFNRTVVITYNSPNERDVLNAETINIAKKIFEEITKALEKYNDEQQGQPMAHPELISLPTTPYKFTPIS